MPPQDPTYDELLKQVHVPNSVDLLVALGAPVAFTFVGVERMDGADTNHYKVVFNMSAAFGVETDTPYLAEYGVWVDGEDHLRQLTFSSPKVVQVKRYSKWGEPVNVIVPPLSEQTTAPAI